MASRKRAANGSMGVLKAFPRVVLTLLAAAAILGGCQRVQPIYSVRGHAVPVAAQKLPLATLERTIYDAATARGWNVDRLRPGLMRATQKWRDHAATVDILYSNESYSIDHVGSANLKEQGDRIHKAYNTYVHALEDEIEKRLYRAAY